MKVNLIYLADDDFDDVEFFQEALNEVNSNCQLKSSKNGKELVENLAAAQILPQLVFIDVNMPIMNGLEALEAIRAQERYNNVMVIIHTTSASLTTIELAYNLGANAFVEKPSDFNVLKKMIGGLLARDWESEATLNETPFVYKQ